jgi:hypothetical protein
LKGKQIKSVYKWYGRIYIWTWSVDSGENGFIVVSLFSSPDIMIIKSR